MMVVNTFLYVILYCNCLGHASKTKFKALEFSVTPGCRKSTFREETLRCYQIIKTPDVDFKGLSVEVKNA